MPASGLASRRGGQNIKPLSMDALKSPTGPNDNGIPTPRTSRGHLLAGLRTAPKTSTASSFASGLASPTSNMPPSMRGGRNSMAGAMYDNSSMYSGPKTSVPRYGMGQQQGFGQMMGYQQHFTPDQILAPPQLQIDDQIQEEMDPNLQAQLLAANQYLQAQQQQLQQQLLNLQAAAQQFQGLNLNAQYQQQQQQAFANAYQQQIRNQQPVMATGMSQPGIYTVYDPVTGQQTLYVDQSQQQLNTQAVNQSQYSNGYGNLQQQPVATPRVQVSPPPVEANKASFRNPSPPRRYDSPVENPAPLPPPSANAFRRGHKKSNSLANNANKGALSINTEEPLKTAGPKTATFPMTPMTATGGYGPGQARAGEHPVRQPRNPPSMDELKAKPTAKHEGSKNFVARTRRSAIHNLVRAGLERRKEARSSGSISPISEDAEEPELVETPMTDNGSDSGRSGSGSLVDVDDAECSLPSSRTSTGSWGAIGSDRPSSRQKVDRNSADSNSDSESGQETGSFASLLKNANRASKADNSEGQRKAPMLVLTSAEKRKVVA
ncbi:hypothetical protein BR93DRAFT_962953 [Coniochaeta sp. PMI_546]|nr:hypothetical protein BR93DRAFT_962953 [Coniochaeta sp. PMI_546]